MSEVVFEAEAIMAEAREAAGLDDFGEDDFLAGLAMLCETYACNPFDERANKRNRRRLVQLLAALEPVQAPSDLKDTVLRMIRRERAPIAPETILRSRRPPDRTQTRRTRQMWKDLGSQSRTFFQEVAIMASKSRRNVVLGVGLVAIIGVVYFAIEGFPPSQSGIEGKKHP